MQRLQDDLEEKQQEVNLLESNTKKKNEELIMKIKEMDEMKFRYEE